MSIRARSESNTRDQRKSGQKYIQAKGCLSVSVSNESPESVKKIRSNRAIEIKMLPTIDCEMRVIVRSTDGDLNFIITSWKANLFVTARIVAARKLWSLEKCLGFAGRKVLKIREADSPRNCLPLVSACLSFLGGIKREG